MGTRPSAIGLFVLLSLMIVRYDSGCVFGVVVESGTQTPTPTPNGVIDKNLNI